MKIAFLLLLLAPAFASAEIHKEASICSNSSQICFAWWPLLPDVDGWQQDMPASRHYSMNAQAPAGTTFSDAQAVIYARAEYKSGDAASLSLEEYAAKSQKTFIAGAPSALEVTLSGEQTSAGKNRFLVYAFYPQGEGNWEQVAYGEDSDKDGNSYFLIFVLSARTEQSYKAQLPAFNEFIGRYR